MNLSLLFTNFLVEDKQLNLDNNNLLNHCFELKKTIKGLSTSNYGGWHSDYLNTTDVVMQPLIDAVLYRCNLLKNDLGFKKNRNVELSNYWVNINEKHNFNMPHSHYLSFFSAVYYVKVPKNSGKISFKNPIPAYEYTIQPDMIENYTHFNAGQWEVQPEEGQLLIFPAWLEHCVLPNESDEQRVSIAFNIKLK
jgi:uncharacterized protein (TIGR02466 family)